MKKIAWVTPIWYLDTDIYVMKYLPRYFDITWFVTKPSGMKLEYADMIDSISKQSNIRIEIVDNPKGFCNFKILLSTYRLQKKLKNFDLVYQPSGFFFALPMMVLMANKRRWIVPIHNVNTPKGARLYHISKFYNECTIKIFRNFATFSKSQAKLLNRKNARANILQTSFMLKDYGMSTRRRTSDHITFMNFGNIVDYKRIDVLICAAQRAYEMTKIDFRVIIAGHCKNWNEKYAPLICYPQLFDLRISRVDDDEIPNLFEECDYFVAPYQDIAQSGSTVVAVNYEKPIIASKIEAFEEIVEDSVNGYLIKPADVDDLCCKIIYIIKNHNTIYSNLVLGQKKIKEKKFDDSVVISQYVDYMNFLVE